MELVRPCTLLEGQEEGAEVPVKQLHPLDRLGPQVQVPLLKQEVLFVLVTRKKGDSLLDVCGVKGSTTS